MAPGDKPKKKTQRSIFNKLSSIRFGQTSTPSLSEAAVSQLTSFLFCSVTEDDSISRIRDSIVQQYSSKFMTSFQRLLTAKGLAVMWAVVAAAVVGGARQ